MKKAVMIIGIIGSLMSCTVETPILEKTSITKKVACRQFKVISCIYDTGIKQYWVLSKDILNGDMFYEVSPNVITVGSLLCK